MLLGLIGFVFDLGSHFTFPIVLTLLCVSFARIWIWFDYLLLITPWMSGEGASILGAIMFFGLMINLSVTRLGGGTCMVFLLIIL